MPWEDEAERATVRRFRVGGVRRGSGVGAAWERRRGVRSRAMTGRCPQKPLRSGRALH